MKRDPEAIKVETGIPMPETTDRVAKYPWSKMAPGDSFLVSCKPGDNKSGAVRSAANVYGTRHQMKFSIRKVDGGVRVWRIV